MPSMIETNYTIRKYYPSGKAIQTTCGLCLPISQIEIQGDRVIGLTPWIFREKFGYLPTNENDAPKKTYLTTASFSNISDANNALDRETYAKRYPSPQNASTVNLAPTNDDSTYNANWRDLAIGVYEFANGDLYVVKPTRATRKLDESLWRKAAYKVIGTRTNRLTENAQTVKFEFRFESGAITRIFPAMRISLARAEELSIVYGNCLMCGRSMKVAESVKRGIGPVCAKRFSF